MRAITDTAVINFQTREIRVYRIVDAGAEGFGVQIFAGEATADGPALASVFPKTARYGLSNITEARELARKAEGRRLAKGWGRGDFTLEDCR